MGKFIKIVFLKLVEKVPSRKLYSIKYLILPFAPTIVSQRGIVDKASNDVDWSPKSQNQPSS